jgi:hypothetical protein
VTQAICWQQIHAIFATIPQALVSILNQTMTCFYLPDSHALNLKCHLLEVHRDLDYLEEEEAVEEEIFHFEMQSEFICFIFLCFLLKLEWVGKKN